MDPFDTIAAVSTAPGEGGIGIMRISGPGALDVGKSLFTPKTTVEIKPRRLYYGRIKGLSGDDIDAGCMVWMKAPHSYTGEDIIELHCHGGTLVLKKVLEAVLGAGARSAEPGEFSKRAFLNGKLDLNQAEAVCDIIRAKTDAALTAARGRLEGLFSKKINAVKETIAELLSRVEAELDFPEEGDGPFLLKELMEGLDRARGGIEKLLLTYGEGRMLREGVKVAILGKPNAGKSSLLNVLLKEERAIVTPLPGTTRDVIEEAVSIKGMPVRLMDTAGLRDTGGDPVESIGVERARLGARDAGVWLFVVDSSAKDFSDDLELLDSLLKAGQPTGLAGQPAVLDGHEPEGCKKIIVVANKTDLLKTPAAAISEEKIKTFFSPYPVVLISALKEDGIEALEERIYEEACGRSGQPAGLDGQLGGLAGAGNSVEPHPGELVASVREKDSLDKALEGIGRALSALKEGLPKEFTAADLRWSLDRLGEITGTVTTEDILDRIFSRFCIGK
ncbi:MAG: tRNA uridine-5-carboxymethylaminomethyl(34) synthesis GTPase MnmE [Deltaproteobacteria bacterium]|nr:tRNA uridine-5-carboxymethylaminomethyl(34) synthesis GTPase MnmE [Deltaproteobacteria bacterium]